MTIANLKSSRLSYKVVVSLSFQSIFSKISRYEADLSDSVIYFEFIRIYQMESINYEKYDY
jgi:hypothetical protein